jgi:thioredoxin-dependent peroxiredoxin
MSKKTREKSSKTPAKMTAKKTTMAKPARGSPKAPAKTPAAKAVKAVVKKSGKTAKSASVKASQKPASKPLKSDPSASPKSAPVEGAKAPGFKLPRDGGDTVSLADYAGKKLVLFFYPRADTPGCTREAIDFTRLKSSFADGGTEVLGISADSVKAQESFRNKHTLSIPLISDEQHEMLEAYGAWGEKSMYGRTFLGIVRTTVLIGANGRIARIWRNVRVDGHADEVLAAAQALEAR